MKVSFDQDERMVISSESFLENMALKCWVQKIFDEGKTVPYFNIVQYDGTVKVNGQN